MAAERAIALAVRDGDAEALKAALVTVAVNRIFNRFGEAPTAAMDRNT